MTLEVWSEGLEKLGLTDSVDGEKLKLVKNIFLLLVFLIDIFAYIILDFLTNFSPFRASICWTYV